MKAKSGRRRKATIIPPSHQGLQGKVAVITGASQGIGLAIAEALAAEGCQVVMTARSEPPLKAAAARLAVAGATVMAQACDVSEERSVAQLFTKIKKQFARIDILINNAGIAHPLASVENLPVAVWREVVDINLTGMFLCTRAALPWMDRGSSIINNLSIAARTTFPGFSAYDASKHGALGFTNTLREEVRGRGIRVLALIPGATATAIWEQFMPEADRSSMLSPRSVAKTVVHALTLPAEEAIEEIRMLPISGTSRE